MINRILDFYLDDLKSKGIKYDDLFENSEYTRISDMIHSTNLPQISIISDYIDIDKLPTHLKNLYNGFEDFCYSYSNVFVTVNDYNITKPIVKMLIEKLYKRCLVEDVSIPHLLYIDTESLVSDLGKLITIEKNNNLDEMVQSIQNDKHIIFGDIYTAKYVFWDKFDFKYNSYFNNYIYEIIKSRYNNCLPNMFFSDKQFGNLIKEVNNKNLGEVINVKWTISLISEQDKIQMNGGIINDR